VQVKIVLRWDGVSHLFGAHYQVSVTVSYGFVDVGALSLTRGLACSLQLLLGLASAVMFGSVP
jgi:hypothetical protein